eukprot:gene10110-13586_t
MFVAKTMLCSVLLLSFWLLDISEAYTPQKKNKIASYHTTVGSSPTSEPTSSSSSIFHCSSYSLSNDSSIALDKCCFMLCGKASLIIDNCGCKGDSVVSLFSGNSFLAYNDDSSFCSPCSTIKFDRTDTTSCTEYCIYQGCYAGSCSGKYNISSTTGTLTAVSTNSPTHKPTSPSFPPSLMPSSPTYIPSLSIVPIVKIPPSNFIALQAIYNSTNGAYWKNSNGWNFTVDSTGNFLNTPCDWYGIKCTCDQIDNNIYNCSITEISLGFNNLDGSIPPEISHLSELTTLMFEYNELTGSLPNEIGILNNLNVISCSTNLLSGRLPEQLFGLTNLKYLAVDVNMFSGPISSSIGLLNKLVYLDLDGNSFTGSLPSSIGSLLNLQQLFLQVNNFSNVIPTSIGSLKHLQRLYLGNNAFSGSIPSSWCNLIDLEILSLQSSGLVCYPACFSTQMAASDSTSLSRCVGPEDDFVCSLTEVSDVSDVISNHVSSNIISIESSHPLYGESVGLVHKNISEAGAVSYSINFYRRSVIPNGFTMIICEGLGSINCHDYSDNSQPLPGTDGTSSLTITSTAISIIYGRRSFIASLLEWGYSVTVTAAIKSSGWDCNSLPYTTTTSSNNQIRKLGLSTYASYASGICDWYGITCDHGEVTKIDLSGLGIVGSVLPYFYYMTALTAIDLSSNKFFGSFPVVLTNTSLQSIDVHSNKINDSFPIQLLMIPSLTSIDISDNDLNGVISDDFSIKIIEPIQLKASKNLLTGSIPLKLSDLPSLSTVDLSYNLFTGEVPGSFCSSDAPNLDITSNTEITCYQSCAGNCTSTCSNSFSSLDLCSPTYHPTFAPTSKPSSTFPSKYIIIIVILTVAMVVGWRMLISYIAQKRNEEERKRILSVLPVHTLLIKYNKRRDKAYMEQKNRSLRRFFRKSTIVTEQSLIDCIMENPQTLYEVDIDGHTAFDLALLHNCSASIVLQILRSSFPDDTSTWNDISDIKDIPEANNFFNSWIRLVPDDNNEEILFTIITEYPHLNYILATLTDERGYSAMEIAGKQKCKPLLIQCTYLLKQYEITSTSPIHNSNTCVIHFAADHSQEHKPTVALKFMSVQHHFNKELSIRDFASFDNDLVISILKSHISNTDSFVVFIGGKRMVLFRYLIVMLAADRNLDQVINAEKIAGSDWPIIRDVMDASTTTELNEHNNIMNTEKIELKIYSNYFKNGCHPNLNTVKTVVMKSLEEKFNNELDRQGLGSPFIENSSIESIINAMTVNQGIFIEGEVNETFNQAVDKIVESVNVLKLKPTMLPTPSQQFRQSLRPHASFKELELITAKLSSISEETENWNNNISNNDDDEEEV